MEFDDPVSRKFDFVAVSGPDGATYQSGDPRVMGSTVTQRLAHLGPAGTYEVAWRVVSADRAPGVRDAEVHHPCRRRRTRYAGHHEARKGGRSQAPRPPPERTGTPSASEPEGSSGTPWWPIGVAVLVVAGGGVLVAARRRHDGDPPSPDEG